MVCGPSQRVYPEQGPSCLVLLKLGFPVRVRGLGLRAV